MSLYNGPARGGTRGGQDQFSWDDVKIDKDRENYLGHSVKAPVGRWQKGRDLTWYTKDGSGPSSSKSQQLKAERDAVKRQEEEAMAIALGLKKGTIQKPKESLSKQDIAEATRRGSEDGEPVDRPKGVGFARYRMSLATPIAESATLPGTTTKDMKTAEKEKSSKGDLPQSIVQERDQKDAGKDVDEKKHKDKKHKKHKKKEHKKEHKEHKRQHGRSDLSDEDSEGQSRPKRSKKDRTHKHKHSRRHRHNSSSD